MTDLERSWCDAPSGSRTPFTPGRTHAMKPVTKARFAIVAVAGAGALVAGTGVAYAYWSATGTGTGVANAGTASVLTSGTATVNGTLYPGGSSTGSIVISNANPFAVKVTSVAFAAATVTTTGTGTCSTTGVTFAPTTAPTTSAPLVVPARSGSSNGTVTFAYTATMDNTSSDGCQGAGFSSTVTLQGTS